MADHHPEQQLVESGIARMDDDGQLALHPLLAAPDVGLVVLRDWWGQVRNLMTEGGCVLSDNAPMFEMLDDKHTCEVLVGAEKAVYLTQTIADTILLRSFGLTAAPIVGLEQLKQRSIDLLCKHYGVKRHLSEREELERFAAQQEPDDHQFVSSSDPRDPLQQHLSIKPTAGTGPASAVGSGYVAQDEEDYIRLTLVRWSPHTLSAMDPAAMQRAIRELKMLKQYRGLEIQEVAEWLPSEENLETIRFALARGEAGWAKDAFLDALYLGIRSVEYVQSPSAKIAPPTNLAEAVEQLHDAILGASGEDSRQRRTEALHNYHRVVAQQITGPMLRQAEAAYDPLQRAMQLQFVQLNALFLEKAPTVREQVLLGLSHQNEVKKNGADNSVSELLAISSQLVALVKEMMQWKPRSTLAPKRLAAPNAKLARRFGDLDSILRN